MKLILPKPGRYVVAVSGGLDSVCLLDLLATRPGYELIVAHFDHGMRQGSKDDLKFVGHLATQYGLPFVSSRVELGASASEANARTMRYRFLHQTREQAAAVAILTAHHQDDRLETLVINLIRGTGRHGVSSIGISKDIKRPLLNVSRKELEAYATAHSLAWREDPTNNSDQYLRNYIRHHILPKIPDSDKADLVRLMNRQAELNAQIDSLAMRFINQKDLSKLSLKALNQLSFKESRDLVSVWLRLNELFSFNRTTIERLTVAAKTKRAGTLINVYGKTNAKVGKDFLALYNTER